MKLDAQCGHLNQTLDTAIRNIDFMAENGTTRELAIVKTKIEEAIMWLEKCRNGVNIELARRLCR